MASPPLSALHDAHPSAQRLRPAGGVAAAADRTEGDRSLETAAERGPDGRDGVAAAAQRQAILEAALAIGERDGWDGVRLYEVAAATGLSLAEVRRHFEHKDALAEAWFDRADAAMLALPGSGAFDALAPQQRVQCAILAWLDALSSHRRQTRAMLRYKLQPEHIHLQALGVLRISRTVQWLRDVARLPAVGWRRELEEAVLTSIYLATFARWLVDDSPTYAETRALLARLLALAQRTLLHWPSPSTTPPGAAGGLY